MKLLKINNGIGEYYSVEKHSYFPIDSISKDGILKMIEYIMENEDAELDEYKEDEIKNKVQQIVYQDLFNQLDSVLEEKPNILAEIKSKYSAAVEKYLKDNWYILLLLFFSLDC